MSAVIDYLHAARLEELADSLRAKGYQLTVEPTGPDEGFDLIAVKNGKSIAYRIKAQSELATSREELEELSKRARDRGYTNFHLVVAAPPREVPVQVEDIHKILAHYITTHWPKGLEPEPIASSLDVLDLGLKSVEVTRDGTRVVGEGLAEANLPPQPDDPEMTSDFFPFTFDIRLGPDLAINQVNHFQVRRYDEPVPTPTHSNGI